MSEISWYKAVNFDMPFLFAVSAIEWKQAYSSAPSCVRKPPETLAFTFSTLIEASVSLSQLLDKTKERCFRHIAMGRRNWLQTGSHFSAQNLAFMFGLLESCKLNKVNFGEYIEDILTRILCGEEVDASFLPCDYVRHFEDGTDAEVTKTSQAVA